MGPILCHSEPTSKLPKITQKTGKSIHNCEIEEIWQEVAMLCNFNPQVRILKKPLGSTA